MTKTQKKCEFFLVSLPGLEDLVLSELNDWYPDVEGKIEHGGISVTCGLAIGLSMNQTLKTPTRILVRIAAGFIARDFPKLYNKILDFDWSKWILPTCQIKVHAATTRSRLKIKNRIEETVEKAFKDWQKKQKIKAIEDHHLDLYIRISDNNCTLSLDTSGERLHKRGLRSHVGLAPIRETIAAAMFQLVSSLEKKSNAESLKLQTIEVIDPMMGSGTFLIEAVIHNQILQERTYAFSNFAPAILESEFAIGTSKNAIQCEKLIGYERSQNAIDAALVNFEKLNTGIDFEVNKIDFFAAKKLPKTTLSRWVFNNPPYGERLKVKEPLQEFYEKLFLHVEEVATPDWACFILPAKISGKLKLPTAWKVKEKRRFLNGGISVIAFVFNRSN